VIVDLPEMILGLLLIVSMVGLAVYYYMKRPASLERRYGHNEIGGDYGGEVARDQVEVAVKVALAHATKAVAGRNPVGGAHIPILVDNHIIGNLWQDADLSKVKIGSYWRGPLGEHVRLVRGDQVVGMIHLQQVSEDEDG